MKSLRILAQGTVDTRNSAFPQAVQLPDGDVLCAFSVGGGSTATGGTDWSRSTDGGLTWQRAGTILPPHDDPPLANFLKLSRSEPTGTLFAFGFPTAMRLLDGAVLATWWAGLPGASRVCWARLGENL